MSIYQDKYIKYKNKYNELKNIKELHNLVGGKTGFNPSDIKDIFKFIEENLDTPNVTDQIPYATYPITPALSNPFKSKYFVICYGPPASGKSISRKIACNVIKQHFNNYLPELYKNAENINELMKTFVDTSVDDIIYNINTKEKIDGSSSKVKTVKDILIENINTVFKLKDINDFEDFEKKLSTADKLELLKVPNTEEKFKEQVSLNQKVYFNYKEIADDVSLLLGAFAILRKKNVFFEIASPAIEYINDLISVLYKWKYNIIFIYPYTTNIDLLCRRSINRGCVEGRVVPRGEIEWKTSGSVVRYYDSVINKGNPNSMINKLENFYVLRYNAQMELDEEKNKAINDGKFNLTKDNQDIHDLIYKDKDKGITVVKVTDVNGNIS
jgi:hypothetical protein